MWQAYGKWLLSIVSENLNSANHLNYIPQQIKVNGVDLLQIDLSHISYISILPFHQRDPFDRLIISQSAVEKMPVVGSDASFDNYQIQRLW